MTKTETTDKRKTKVKLNKKITQSKVKPKRKPKNKITNNRKIKKYDYEDYKIQKIVNTRGNYYSINIPSKYVERLGIHRGAIVNIRVVSGKLVIKPII